MSPSSFPGSRKHRDILIALLFPIPAVTLVLFLVMARSLKRLPVRRPAEVADRVTGGPRGTRQVCHHLFLTPIAALGKLETQLNGCKSWNQWIWPHRP